MLKQYLSYSALIQFEADPEEYANIYFYGKKRRINTGQGFGKEVAESLEKDELTGDCLSDIAMSKLTRFEINDKILEDENGVEIYYEREDRNIKVPFLKDGKEIIPILIKPDTLKENLTGFREYKTSQKLWTRKKVDENPQITFYAMGVYLKSKRIPNDIGLEEVVTVQDDYGKVTATGEVIKHPTSRSMSQVLNMIIRCKKAWRGIAKLEKEKLL